MSDYPPTNPNPSPNPGRVTRIPRPDDRPDFLSGPGASVWSRRVAHVLDTFLKIPGTTARVGLDPIIGLIPGVGDAISTFMGGVILVEALRRRVPGILLVRIGGNMLLNASVGAIPVVGDLFSAWFKSNSKNHAMLHAFLQGNPNPPADPQSKWVWLGLIVFLAILAGLCVLAFWLLAWVWNQATGH
ncbi:MAG: rane protein of unknown function [Verrucomicrobiales bacterium]|nr:rane protein of unknown function [Verrucomicrobiales bacterium]